MTARCTRLFLFLLLTLLLAALTGCKAKRSGTIRGIVRYNDKPLESGTVMFLAADGQQKNARIGKDGSYEMDNVPVGLVRIGVDAHQTVPPGYDKTVPGVKPPPDSGINQEGKPGAVPKLPEGYRKPETSPLTYDVTTGDQQKNIDIPQKDSPPAR